MELNELAPPQKPSNSWIQNQPIVVDLGSYHTRVGMASAASPAHEFPSFSAKCRGKNTSTLQVVVGNEAMEQSKSTLKSIFEQGTVANWDVVEHVFNYSFELLGVDSDGMVDSPIILSEQMAGPHAARATFTEILFEGYGIPELKTCVDAVAAYSHSFGSKSGFGIHLGNESCHVTPFVNGEALINGARRLNWGGRQASEFMQQLLALKYPAFPTRLTLVQASQIFERCCYVAKDYRQELAKFLDVDGLDKRERIIQLPPPLAKEEPSREQLEAQAERRRESGRRLQEQAKRAREEKVARLESELTKLRAMQEDDTWEDQFPTQDALMVAINRINRALNPEAEREEPAPETPLIKIDDADLDADQIKEKRKQKLLKANYDARMKARAEKQQRNAEIERVKKENEDWRARDLDDWIKTKRAQLFAIRDKLKEKQSIRQQLNDRRSLASKMRMKSIVMLASGEGKKKRKLKDSQDNFGANDDDWEVYNNAMDDEDDEELAERMQELQGELLQYDPSFSLDEMHEQIDWRKSTIHKFLYGAHPFDADSATQSHQLNVNIERIRVPEVLFEPMINGVDQAGLSEILGGMTQTQKDVAICLTGGTAQLPGLGDRFIKDLTALLPCNTPISVHKSENPMLDTWKGMATSGNDGYVTKQEYEENGYFVKRHPLGNIY